MKAIIAQFYKTEEGAEQRAIELWKQRRGKIAYYVLCTKKGFFVISESQARAMGYKTSYKDRRGAKSKMNFKK